MMFFNTAGPVNQPEHYKIDPLSRWDLSEILHLIDQKKYFILHAPRQTGKTSALLALQQNINANSQYLAVYANVEGAQTARNDVARGLYSIITELDFRIKHAGLPLGENKLKQLPPPIDFVNNSGTDFLLNSYLKEVCRNLSRPLLLFLDEIDSLIGDTLVAVLRQLRSGYDLRPDEFPASIILCGVRDIKDYRIHTSSNDIITGGSCFNIKSESLTLGNFTLQEIQKLYLAHTMYTGQKFEDACFPRLMELTGGQPWLINALAYEVTYSMKENRDPSVIITVPMLEEAKERLILSRAPHLDQLADKLSEERVRRVIEPMLIGSDDNSSKDDNQYCIDLGLIRKTNEGLVISNEIYREVIPRELTDIRQTRFLAIFKPEWINNDGLIDTQKLFTLFQEFWRENSEIWKDDLAGYIEAAPHLTFHAFLQRVANGRGRVDREYAYGTKRADLVLKWKNEVGMSQTIVIELKMVTEHYGFEKARTSAMDQINIYVERAAADEAHIIIFDRTGKMGWKDNPLQEKLTNEGRTLYIWGM